MKPWSNLSVLWNVKNFLFLDLNLNAAYFFHKNIGKHMQQLSYFVEASFYFCLGKSSDSGKKIVVITGPLDD